MATSVVIIEEQTGRKRRVELVGGGLPIQGANWSGQQLISASWNPGNPEGVQHVLGPQEMPSDWDFMWRTNILARTPVNVTDPQRRITYTVVRALTVAELLEDIGRGGALLKVVWISSAAGQAEALPRLTRVGRITTWDINPDRPDDVAASFSFQWLGRGLDQPKVAGVTGENMLALTQAAINACNAAALSISADIIRQSDASKKGPSASTFTLGQLEAIADGPRQMMDNFARECIQIQGRLKAIGDLVVKVKETPAALLGRLVDVANNGVAIANKFCDEVSREGPETQSTRNKVAILSRNTTYFSGAQTSADVMAEILERVAHAARRRQSSLVPSAGTSRRGDQPRVGDSFATYFPRKGDTFLSISLMYYGTPDLADELAVANGLPSYTIVPPRMPLIVPTRSNLDSSNRNRI